RGPLSKVKETRRRTIRARGEFDPSAKQTLSRDDKRDLFLFEVQQTVPDVLKSLYNHVFLKFRSHICCLLRLSDLSLAAEMKVFNEAHPNSPLRGDDRATAAAEYFWRESEFLSYWYNIEAANESHSELCLIREAVRQWSIRWHLDADWYRDRALKQLLYWDDEGIDETLDWGTVSYGSSSHISNKQEIELLPSGKFPRWFPFLKTESKYLEEVRQKLWFTLNANPVWAVTSHQPFKSMMESLIEKLIKEVRKNYCRKLSELYIAKGYKRAGRERKIDAHIRWTVQALICDRTIEEIANAEGIEDDEGVSKAVQRTLRLLGLPRKEGRPLGRKDSSLSPRSRKSRL
ncbi:MAG: hypothetical protein AB1631_27595, partial [Acidobacteriota bacterium]